MANAFDLMIDDVFRIPQFIDSFQVYSESSSSSDSASSITCIKYAEEDDAVYSQFGMDDGIQFILTCKCKDFTPQKNMKIKFHNKVYRIVSWKQDSFQLTYNLNLKSVNSK